MVEFERIMRELNLSEQYENEEGLDRLKKWCNENISQDIEYDGSSEEKYADYLDLARNYLENFLPNVPTDLSQKVSQFGNLNALQFAAQKGFHFFLKNLAKIPENLVNEKDHNGMTPLNLAARQGNSLTIQALLEKGADLTLVSARKESPLQSVLFVPMWHSDNYLEKKNALFKELWKKAPETIRNEDIDGNNVLHLLASHNFPDLLKEVVQAQPSLASRANNQMVYPVDTAVLNNQLDSFKSLIQVPNAAALTDGLKRIPLHYAARYGDEKFIEACIPFTTDINTTDNEGKTPLLLAAEAGNMATVKALMERGADASILDVNENTILHLSIKSENAGLVEWVLKHVPEEMVNQNNGEGNSPLTIAHQLHNTEIEDLLKSFGAVNSSYSI
ncbi:Ankyrin repeat protein [Legionella adelaidensis]|uniref:Ankyrin repeat protein n=2 Tax=Legionella adelaidensis TaxID=45056 RepID=A0A0W0R6D8_9GAMM|nr:ankyrin repeat domain-containing protein [Legionella adelaidensis]KTC66646.1 Ankyrin repeat protein [Legionella adelaidensis]